MKLANESNGNERIEVEMPEALARALELESIKTPGGMDALAAQIWSEGVTHLKGKRK